MGRHVDQVGQAVYSGLWAILQKWFRVPRGSVELPPAPDDSLNRSFRPDPGFLRYLKTIFWIVCLIIDVALALVWLLIFIEKPSVGMILAPVFLILIVVPDIIAYVALHLRFDTTWYAMNNRSLRIRRGVMVIHETTITFENIQNISIHRGPLQQYCGIAKLVVETAGGGSSQPGETSTNVGIIEGIEDPESIRDLIMARVRSSKSAGLGDERDDHRPQAGTWSPAHIEALQEIRAALSTPA